MRQRIKLWSAVIAFQIIYGALVFLAAREIYQDPSAASYGEPVEYQATNRKAPHPVPQGMPSASNAPILPGSERITVDDAKRLVAGTTGENYPVTSAGPRELAKDADRHFAEGLYPQAAAEYAKVLEKAPDNVDIHNNLGLTLHYVGRSAEAVDILEKGIAINGAHQRIRLTLGFVQSALGDVDAARNSLSVAAKLDPDSRVGLEAKRLLAELPSD